MKLRELFDKLTPGQLDTEVTVKLVSILLNSHVGTFRALKAVEVQDDGSIILVVEE